MANYVLSNKMPIKVYYKNECFEERPEIHKNKIDNQNRYANSLNKKVYSYPIALYKEPTLFEQYKERLILSQKSDKKRSLLNKYYHHIFFNSHSKKLILNSSNSYSNIKAKKIIQHKTYYKNLSSNNIINNKYKENIYYNTFYNKDNNSSDVKVQNNLTSSRLFNYNYNYDNNIYQQMYLSEVKKRGFNYHKIKVASLQRMALNNFCKSEIDEYNSNNNNVSFILEAKRRTFFPQMKKFLINKYIDNKDKSDKLNEINYRKKNNQGVINIKNNPNFKFHIFHDQKGKMKELDKPCIRSLKMTKAKVRDLKIMSKINKIKDPEIIKMYKSII